MSDEQEVKKQSSSAVEGLTVQGFGGAIGVTWMLYQKSKGNFYEAGFESAIGTLITGLLYGAYWLFKPRINRWRNGRYNRGS